MNLKIEVNVEMTMRDGTILRADIYRPDDMQAYPAVIVRTPYVKDRMVTRWGELSPIRLAKAGYAVVWQDTRGTGCSDGEYTFMFDQGNDGYDSCEWIAAQPWCDGNVGGYGHSYFAYTLLAMAAKRPPHLRCIAPFMQSCLPKFSGGFIPNALHADWLVKQVYRYLERVQDPGEQMKIRELLQRYVPDGSFDVWHIPEIDMIPKEMEEAFEYMKDYRYKVERYDQPDSSALEGRPIDIAEVSTPMLLYGGWYDTSSKNGPVENYITLTSSNKNEAVRENTHLVMGPWNHGMRFVSSQGELRFPWTEGEELDINGQIIRFFDYNLKKIENGYDKDAKVKIYVMGKNVWRAENEWPIARTEMSRYYLHSGGSANTRGGDGVLNLSLPGEEPPDTYCYNPMKPTPSRVPGGAAGAVQDFGPIEDREDVLVYSSPVLKKGIEVTGFVQLELEISSDCPDTDFFGRLIDVYPDGRSINLTEGGVRARYNNTYNEKLLELGEIRHLTCNMGNISNYFKPGHRIRLEITSSCFPMIDRNHNTGNRIGVDKDIVVANNTVYHNPLHLSYLHLPIIPEEMQETS